MLRLLETRVWLVPLVFTILVAATGWYAHRSVSKQIGTQVADTLRAAHSSRVHSLELWAEQHRETADAIARDPRVSELVGALVSIGEASADPADALSAAPERASLDAIFAPLVEAHEYFAYRVVTPAGLVLASNGGRFLGSRLDAAREPLEIVASEGKVLTRPLRLPADRFPEAAGKPVLLVLAPVRDEADEVIAIVGLGIGERQIEELLAVMRPDRISETYAFDREARMLSPPRDAREIAALEPAHRGESGADAADLLQVRDPGGNVLAGFEPKLPILARPLTRMAADAVSGNSGQDIEGYRDYRGVPVVGAWAWVPELDIGVATEIDAEEAYRAVLAGRRWYVAVVVLLLTATIAIAAYSTLLVRARRANEQMRQLGRYELEGKIGEGGMGKVYRARHALLRRPSAIKLLAPGHGSRESALRFEREVQATSSLTHPNTIAIFDYGHTPEGVFYYVMEYLDGATVGECVTQDGAQPEGRVIHIMTQACGSIAEAHAAGLVHRDLKPANLMLCERGGLLDFVKVLDFGLVRDIDRDADAGLTNIRALTGTPLYLSPEALRAPETVDARSDLYQLGAVAYFLLTGTNVFAGESVVEVLEQHLYEAPVPPSQALGRPISPDLEALVMACLAKDPEDRPESAAALGAAFAACASAGSWSQDDAREWWQRWRATRPTVEVAAQSVQISGCDIDLAHR